MDKRKNTFPTGVGVSSLLVIFAVLCLTVFALLSISTVKADLRLSEQSVRTVEGYYEADCRAEEILARLRGGEIPSGVTKNGDIYTYACPISDTQTLAVQVKLSGTDYEILRWQAVSTVDWQADDSLPVWNGEGE